MNRHFKFETTEDKLDKLFNYLSRRSADNNNNIEFLYLPHATWYCEKQTLIYGDEKYLFNSMFEIGDSTIISKDSPRGGQLIIVLANDSMMTETTRLRLQIKELQKDNVHLKETLSELEKQ